MFEGWILSALSTFTQDGGLAEAFLEPRFGLRSASGEVERRRKKRLAKRSRSETPPPSR